MPRLFSYTIPIDDGAAPNPFRGMCSLAICKPGIRRAAKEGDWVAGLGSRNAPGGDLSGHLVYAMRIETVLSLRDYDRLAQDSWSHRLPNVRSADLAERLGDCIYDYSNSTKKPRQRASVHGPENIDTDLRGENALISRNFYYWGRNAICLPENLLVICHQTQGHRSVSNDPYIDLFETWLRGLELVPGQIYGWPDYTVHWDKIASCGGCPVRKHNNENDIGC